MYLDGTMDLDHPTPKKGNGRSMDMCSSTEEER
jgi:hypothetical protein